MIVRMNTAMAGESVSLRPGQRVEVPDPIGEAWIRENIAVPDDAPEKPVLHFAAETAALDPALEKAAGRKKRG